MPKTYQEILDEARRLVPELTADELRRLVDSNSGNVVLDVREPSTVVLDLREKEEYRDGHLAGALSVPRGFLEMQVEGHVPTSRPPSSHTARAAPVPCSPAASSRRWATRTSARSAAVLAHGRTVVSRGCRTTRSRAKQVSRYSRHFLLDEVGEAGQAKLLNARVLCSAREGLARRWPSTLPQRVWARSASWMTTSSTCPTCSARSCTRPSASARQGRVGRQDHQRPQSRRKRH